LTDDRSGYTRKVSQRSWHAFVDGTDRCAHGVQIYAELEELSHSVASYLAAGFALGEPGVVVATNEHFAHFKQALAKTGWKHDDELLVFAEAEEALVAIMDGDVPAAAAFERVVGGLLDQAAERFPERNIRAFGEMVDILHARGEQAAAVQLEELWNDLATRRQFSLLCGYRLNVFDRETQSGSLPDVCRTHSHVLPAADHVRFGLAVDDALEEALGYDQAGKVYVMVNREVREADGVPFPQKVLMWLSQNMPASADRVLAAARERYFAPLTATE
jgi:DcmR-like sensory protein